VKLLASHYRTARKVAVDRREKALRSNGTIPAPLICGPGFFDLQCNGFAGVDFNHPETTPDRLATALSALPRTGVTQVLPTIITADPERLETLLRNLVAARALDPQVARAVPGFHLEGPWISPHDGARGAHPRAHVLPLDRALWRRLQRAAGGLIRLVTLAPEVRGAIPFIRQLRAEGVLPAIGHTLATAAQISAAADAGALLSTHLGNGCPQMLHRHHNPIYPQLADDRLTVSLIADGVHLPSEVLRAFSRAKGITRTVLVTDAMAAAGAPPGRFTLGDLTLEVGRDRIVRQPGEQQFAGSALTMDAAVETLVRATGAPLADAWDAAARNPRRLFALATRQQFPAQAAGTVVARWDPQKEKLSVVL